MSATQEEVERQWDHVHERDIAALEVSGEFRVLRRFKPRRRYYRATTERLAAGLVVDCEATGLDTETDKMIEVAFLPFTFDPQGCVHGVLEPISMREDPGAPLSPEITELTGLTDADLAGQKFDDATVNTLASVADLVIAHKAEYDRPMFERRFPIFAESRWACSMRDINWRKLGIRSAALDYILMRATKTFHEEHRATTDCESVLHILAQSFIGENGQRRHYLSYLLDAVRAPTLRLMPDTPYEMRGKLKGRGYQAQYRNGKFAYWYKDIPATDVALEEEWLVREAQANPTIRSRRVTAKDRYSVRA